MSRSQGLTIFHLTDVHGRIEPELRRVSGAPPEVLWKSPGGETWAGLIAVEPELKRQAERAKERGGSLFLHAGDMVGIELPHDRYGKGKVTQEALEHLCRMSMVDAGYSAVGNHEMDHGVDNFVSLNQSKALPFLCGNLRLDGKVTTQGLKVIKVRGWRVGLVSYTTRQTANEAPKEDRDRIRVHNNHAAINSLCERRKAGKLDLAIALVHLHDHEDQALAARWPELDLIIGGHSHNRRRERLGRSWWMKAGSHASFLGFVRFEAKEGRLTINEKDSGLLPLTYRGHDGSELKDLFDRTNSTLEHTHPTAYRPLARLPRPVLGSGLVRKDSSPVGRAVAKAVLDGCRREGWVHAAFINGGNIRADIQGRDGWVRPSDLMGVVPYRNRVVVMEAESGLIRKVLANAVACWALDPAGFVQTAGLKWSIRGDGRLGAISVETPEGWVRSEDLGRVRLASIDWLVNGGHGYGFLASTKEYEGDYVEDLWSQLLTDSKVLEVEEEDDAFTMDEALIEAPRENILKAAEADFGDRLEWAWRKLGR